MRQGVGDGEVCGRRLAHVRQAKGVRGRTIHTRVLVAVAAGCSVAVTACGSDEAETPEACLAGPDVYLASLQGAPGEVRLDGETPISECVVKDQSGAELATVGEAIVGAAIKLNIEALDDPDGQAAVRLGYLVGAIQEGSSDTGGIHADLVRRLDAAARFSPEGQLPAEFERVFGRGYAAGQESG